MRTYTGISEKPSVTHEDAAMGIEHPAAMTWGHFLGKSFQKVSETRHFSDQYGFLPLRHRPHSCVQGRSPLSLSCTTLLALKSSTQVLNRLWYKAVI
jgi:hypothetical protein